MNEGEKQIFSGEYSVTGGNYDNAGQVSSRIKAVLKQLGIKAEFARKVALVTYEAEINVASYARKGVIHLTVMPDKIIVEVDDEGQGIPDIEKALKPGFSTATDKIREMGFGAGMGLDNIRTYSDTFFIESTVGFGTNLKMIINTNNLKNGTES